MLEVRYQIRDMHRKFLGENDDVTWYLKFENSS